MPKTSNQFADISDFADKAAELAAARQHLHAHPELSFQEQETAAYVAERLESWGYEVTRNVGGLGVVGGAGPGRRPRSPRPGPPARPPRRPRPPRPGCTPP
ncbi:hypothetical protein NKI14_04935, partial [Mesorhizobium sp. M0767]